MVIKSYSCNRIQPPAVQLQANLEAQNITQWHLVLEGHGHQAIQLQLLPPAFQAYLKAQCDTVYTRYSKVMVIMSYSCNCSHLLFKSTLKHSIWHSNTWYLKVMVIRSYSCNYSHLLSKPTPKYTMKQCHLALEGHGHHVIQLQQYTATWCSSLPPEHTIIHGHIWHVNIHTLRKCSVLSPPCQFWWTAIICVKFNFYLFV